MTREQRRIVGRLTGRLGMLSIRCHRLYADFSEKEARDLDASLDRYERDLAALITQIQRDLIQSYPLIH